MIAKLGMYDRPETAAAHDRFWTGIRERLGEGPGTLDRECGDMDAWLSPDLFFAQTCGFPFRTRLIGHVALIGTPDYGVEGCPPGYYQSVLIKRTDDPRERFSDFGGTRLAYNDDLSQSGWAAPMHHAQEAGIRFGEFLKTGNHRHSAIAVEQGRADIAAIDCVTWRMIERWDAWSKSLTVVGRTTPTPGLPYIAARGADRGKFLKAISETIAALSVEDQNLLMLKDIVRIPEEAYLAVPTPRVP